MLTHWDKNSLFASLWTDGSEGAKKKSNFTAIFSLKTIGNIAA